MAIGQMDKKITIALLIAAVTTQIPAIGLVLKQIAFAGLSIDIALFFFVFAFMVLTGVGTPFLRANADESSMRVRFLLVIVSAAVGACLWGVLSNEPVWVFRGSGLCVAALIALFAGFSTNRLFYMGLLLCMVPLSLWKTAPWMHSLAQWLASSFAGCLLDIYKVFYFAKGNVLGLVSTDFLQNESCSGLRLIYPMVLLVIAYGFFKGYRFLRFFYLLVVLLFWAIVAQGAWIAVDAIIQDGQSAKVLYQSGASSIVLFATVLLLTWSGDQFCSAFSGPSSDKDSDISIEPGKNELREAIDLPESRVPWIALWSMLVGLAFLGGWSIYKNQWAQGLNLRQSAAISAVESLKLESGVEGWTLGPATKSAESFNPVFRQSPSWNHWEWELTPEQSREGSMKLRIDGIWITLPKPDWLWRWYGWKTDGVISEDNGSFHFGMKRSIVEEAYVVTKGVRVVGDRTLPGPVVQVSLVHESVRPITEKQHEEQKELHARWVEAIEKQFGFDAAIGDSIR
jgi:hypothetical protein